MGFHRTYLLKVFVGITAALSCVRAISEPIKFNDSPKTSRASRKLSELLSPALFSEADPFQYLIRGTSKLPTTWDLKELNENLQSGLQTNQFPQMYIPYARALQSITRGLLAIQDVIWNIQRIQKNPDHSRVPLEISSPPELSVSGLYSAYIFSDPEPAAPLFDILLKIPKKDIPNLIIRLENFANITKGWRSAPLVQWQYPRHADELASFLRRNYLVLDDLKRAMATIERISIASKSKLPDTSSSVDSSDQQSETESDDLLGIIGASDNLSSLLSPAIFSNPDPFQYLLGESSKIQTSSEIEQLKMELRSRLTTDQFSKRYSPYARALYAIIRCQDDLRIVKSIIDSIRKDPDCDASTKISSLSGLFSSDIFSDPDPVTRLVNKLLRIPKNGIPQLRIQLQNDVETLTKLKDAPVAWKKYIRYAQALLLFLGKDSLLDDLGREMVEIQRITMISRRSSDNTLPNKEPELPATSAVDQSLHM